MMKFRIYIFLLIAAFTFSQHIEAQLNPNYLSVIPETDGAQIYDVLTDRMGNVWFATQSGLVWYDGYDFKRFYPDPNDSSTIGDILTYRLFEDRSGKIWIGCMNYISVYNPETKTFINYTFNTLTDIPLWAQPFAYTITQDGNGRMYFGIASFLGVIASHALLYYDENNDSLSRFECSGNTEIRNIAGATTDPNGDVWICGNSGLMRIDTIGKVHPVPLPENFADDGVILPKAVISDSSGKIWLTNDRSKLFVYDPKTNHFMSWSMEKIFDHRTEYLTFYELAFDKNENIWIGTNLGPVFFNRSEKLFETFDESVSQKTKLDQVVGLCFDTFGDLWFATSSTGLIRYSKKNIFKSFIANNADKSSITSGWVNKIIESEDGSIKVTTSGAGNSHGFNIIDLGTNAIEPLQLIMIEPDLGLNNVIFEMKKDEFLLGSNRGYAIFNVNTRAITNANLELQLDTVYIFTAYRDSRNNTWYCTTNGLFLESGERSGLSNFGPTLIDGTNGINNEVTHVFEGKKHGLWILTNSGLFSYNYVTDKIERHGYDKAKGDVFMGQDINSLYEDEYGIVWVGVWQGGLSRYDPENGTIKTYTTSDGLPSMSIQGILADEKNNALWLGTFVGLSRFSIKDEQFNNFSLDDGIQGLLFADGACLKTSKGQFIFGGNNGITVFNPDDIAENSIPPKVFITDLKVGNKSQISGLNSFSENESNKPKDIVLGFNQNNISIEYTGIHYANPAKNKFSYQLQNYDNDWREVGNLRTAFYYGLPPGSYTFWVKAANSSGVWSREGATIHFRITPPWWRTWWAYIIYGMMFLLIMFLIDRIQRRRLLEKERTVAREKELEQAKEIEKAYHQLKTTQSQLIHAEKMASLGELTAGIAHEIQNPLNFVNNFSEVSNELIEEIEEERAKKQESRDEELISGILEDIKQNLEKINHHGKRADAIVKGMLQHSRSSAGQKEPTDINALADEYLRLAYHGLRAKDKTFNATMKTDFDQTIGKINIIPQDISRVILNLITNAFYACAERLALSKAEMSRTIVNEKTKTSNSAFDEQKYLPVVSVSTRNIQGKVEIIIKDNGNGIPPKVLDKIFQPFFTTKPTGQGTGLGLSLSYDIIKAHGGELRVDTREGEGSEFIIVLPI